MANEQISALYEEAIKAYEAAQVNAADALDIAVKSAETSVSTSDRDLARAIAALASAVTSIAGAGASEAIARRLESTL